MNMRLRYVALPALFVAIVGPASALVTIDNFTTGAADLLLDPSVSSATWIEGQQTGSSTVLAGGERDVLLRITSNPFAQNLRFRVVPGAGASFYAADPGVQGFVALDYDAADTEGNNGTQTASAGGMNLNLSTENTMRVTFAFTDSPVNVTIDAYTYGTTLRQSTFSFQAAGNLSTDTTYSTLFANFTAVSGGGVLFSDVDRLVYTFTPVNAAGDFAVRRIDAVPEPASMAALAIGGLGLLARRRRKK